MRRSLLTKSLTDPSNRNLQVVCNQTHTLTCYRDVDSLVLLEQQDSAINKYSVEEN